MAEQFSGSSVSPMDAVSKVELSVSCSNLKDMDVFSKSDPVVFLYEKRGKEWQKIGRTEVIDNNLNPKFSKTFVVDFRFEEVQTLNFAVYDVDDKRHVDDTRRHDFIGAVECSLADIVAAGQQYKRTLRKGGEVRGQIILQAEEVQESKSVIQMRLSASKLDKKDLFGKSDPFVEIAKAQEGGSFTVVYRSKPIMKTLDPSWPLFEISIQKLCSGDWDRTLRLSVWDWNRSGSHDFIGQCTTSLRDICIEKGGQVCQLDLINPELKKKKKKYTKSGTLNFTAVRVIPVHSFVDYIKGGCQINLLVAIDFTASNGKPHLPTSLHYISPYKENEYVFAIKSVGSVLAPYDTDQMIPVFGFGARLPPGGQVSHCFPLSFNYHNPEVNGIQGILDAYYNALRQVDLFGPTNFSSFLDKTMEYCNASPISQNSQNYFILLVITDGVISDMQRTVDRIVAASKLPLSIVIVGVGGADFTNMEILDADDTPLISQSGVKMSRDIVQFVPLRQFQNQTGANFSLSRETLAEIPGQFLSYMKSRRITPNPPVLRHRDSTFSIHGRPSSNPAGGMASSPPPYPGPLGPGAPPINQQHYPPTSYPATNPAYSYQTAPPYPI